MAEDAIQSEGLDGGSDSIEIGTPELAWSQAWQVPVLLLGLGLLVIGVYFAMPRYSEPDYPGVLSDVEVHLKAEELEQAEATLNKITRHDPQFDRLASDEVKAHAWQLYGDLQFRQIDKQVWQGIATSAGKENLKKIESHYREAERMGRVLPPSALRRYAETLAAQGANGEALKIVDRMPVDMNPPRYSIVRDLIERRVKTDPDPASEAMARLISRFEKELESEKDRSVKREQQVWVMALKCERLLQAGDPDGVLGLLVDGGMIRLMDRGASEADLAPLTVRLGEAYARKGDHEHARLHLRKAQENLQGGHKLVPRIRVAFGDITLAEGFSGAYDQAYSHYRQAYDTDKMGPSSIDAIIGLGHTEANRDGRFPEALEWFKLAVQRMLDEQVPAWDKRRKRLAHFLRDVHVVREYERGRFAEALKLIKAYEPLESPDLAAKTLGAFASIYEKLGEQSLENAKALTPDSTEPGLDPNLMARRIHNQDAAVAFEQAGNYFRLQAGELTHTTDEHGDALWQSAKSYEKAQRWDKAVEVYNDYLQTSDRADRREEAAFRVAQALLAEDQPAAAVARLRKVIESAPTGEWAKQAYAPMAQGLSELDRWDEAEALLRSVVEDHPSIGPESPYYHDALVALGRLLYKRGEQDPVYYARAIEVLGTDGGAVGRYQHDDRYRREVPILRYMLADCLRLSAQGLVDAAEQARTETERMELLNKRRQRLADAQMYYNQVVVEMEGWHADTFSQIELQYFRNAQFYQADCAFDRGGYETAIGLYLDAVGRWQDHPAALVGWVQIMNAYAELGEIEEARVAHARAMELFNQMPEGAFSRADSLMTRQRWDAWLQWMQQLDLFGPTAGVRTD